MSTISQANMDLDCLCPLAAVLRADDFVDRPHPAVRFSTTTKQPQNKKQT